MIVPTPEITAAVQEVIGKYAFRNAFTVLGIIFLSMVPVYWIIVRRGPPTPGDDGIQYVAAGYAILFATGFWMFLGANRQVNHDTHALVAIIERGREHVQRVDDGDWEGIMVLDTIPASNDGNFVGRPVVVGPTIRAVRLSEAEGHEIDFAVRKASGGKLALAAPRG